MNIQLRIERLIIDGLPLAQTHRQRLQATVESELARLLTEGGVASALVAGGTVPQLAADNIQLADGADPVQLGRQIARSVYGGLGSE